MDMRIRKTEIILAGAVLICAVLAIVLMNRKKESTPHGTIRITVGGETYGEYSLGEDQDISINGHNTMRIHNGQAYMVQADCPDHICITQSPIDDKGGMIICLPNQVFVEGIPLKDAGGESELTVDAVVH